MPAEPDRQNRSVRMGQAARQLRLYLRPGGHSPALRWLAAGLGFMGVNTALLYLLIGRLGLAVWLGTLVAAEIATAARYFVNDHWVFGHRRPTWRRFVQYHAASAAALIAWWTSANLLTLWKVPYLLAGILAVGCSTGLSFLSNFRWIWGKRSLPSRSSVSGVLLLREDGAALLQLRDDKPDIMDPGIWVVPGGHSDPGETPEQAAIREFEEETCYRCPAVRPLAEFTAGELGYQGDYRLCFFWASYDGHQRIECREGQALRFVQRPEAEGLPRRDYLTRVWDLALAARDACQS